MNLEDSNEMIRLMTIEEPTKEDMDSTFNLYKKYINPGLESYRTGCGCGNAIERLFDILKGWYITNHVN
jgi:hypothetical protein